MTDVDREQREKIKKVRARIKWLTDQKIRIKAVSAPHKDGCYRYYELNTPIPGKNFDEEHWSDHSRDDESLDDLVDRLMAQEKPAAAKTYTI